MSDATGVREAGTLSAAALSASAEQGSAGLPAVEGLLGRTRRLTAHRVPLPAAPVVLRHPRPHPRATLSRDRRPL